MRATTGLFWLLMCVGGIAPASAGFVSTDGIDAIVPGGSGSVSAVVQYHMTAGSSPISLNRTEIRQNGGTIDVVIFKTIGAFAVGGYLPGEVALPALPVGQYTVRLLSADLDEFTGVGYGPEYLVDTEQFSVAAGTVATVPTLQRGITWMLALSCLLLGAHARRRMVN